MTTSRDWKAPSFKLVILFAVAMLSNFFSIQTFAVSGLTTYQAKIVKPDGSLLEDSNISFKFTIVGPSGSCVLYSETYSAINMTGTGGLITFALGSGSRSFPTSGTLAFSDVFNNGVTNLNCESGGTYTPALTDNRKVVMQFHDTLGWQTLPAMAINAVPYSMYAGAANSSDNSKKLNGLDDTAFVQKTLIPSCNSLNQALQFNGATFSCVTIAGGGGGGSVVSVSGTATEISSTGGTSPQLGLISVGSAGTYFKVTTDSKGRVISGSATLAANDITTALGYTPANEAASGTYLVKSNNLSDIPSSSTARTNLGLGSISLLNTINLTTNITGILPDANIANIGSGITSGTQYTKVTVDSKGRVTSGAQLSSSDVTSALGFTPASNAAVSGALIVTNNLSDLASSLTARTNLGLAALATKSNVDLGTADATGTLAVARLPSFSGDATSVSGSNVLTLNNSGVVANTYGSSSTVGVFTVDSKGRITSATNVSLSALGAVAGITAAATAGNPIVIGGTSSNPTVDITNATSSTAGYLSAADFTTFNNKLGPATNFFGDISGNYNSVSVNAIKGVSVTLTALANNNILQYNGSAFVNRAIPTCAANEYLTFDGTSYSCAVDSGSAGTVATVLGTAGQITSTGSATITLSLNDVVSSATVGSANAVPSFTFDSKGRITAATSNAYQDANGAAKGIVQIGPNITVSTGVISVTSANVISALGFTPADSATSGSYLAIANNLSDLTSSSTARTSLGLGSISILNTIDLATNITGILPDANIANIGAGVVSGTQYTKVTVDGKGRVTSGAQLSASDVTSALGFTPANNAAVSGALIATNNLSDLTSATVARTNLELGSLATKSSVDLSTADATGTLANARLPAFAGDASSSVGSNILSVNAIKGVSVTLTALATNNILQFNGTDFVNRAIPTCAANEYLTFNGTTYSCAVDSGSAGTVTSVVGTAGQITSTGSATVTLSLTDVVSSATVGSANAIPSFTFDSKGRITAATSNAYQDANGAAKGIVQIGPNITVSTGVISVTSANVISALGFTPANNAAVSGALIATNNLSDVVSASAARSNLGLGSISILNTIDLATNITGILPDVNIANIGSGIASGTQYTKVTVDGKGRVTSGAQLSANDVTSALGFTPANNAAVSGALIATNNLSDLTSATVARTNLELGSLATLNSLDLGSSLASGTLSVSRLPAFSGDATSVSGSSVLTLNNSGVVANTYGSSSTVGVFTVDNKGRVTSASSVPISISAAQISGGGLVASVSAAATVGNPIVIGGTATNPTVDITQATSTTAGYLSGTDWFSFYNKQNQSAELNGISGLALTGIVQRTGSGAYTALGTTAPLAVTAGNIVLNTSTGLIISGTTSLAVDVGTTAGKIVQLDASGKLPAIDGSQLTNLPSSGISSATVFSGDVSGLYNNLVLNSVGAGVTSGTQYTKVTVDGKGRVTSGAQLASSDVTTALGYTPASSTAATQWTTSGTTINYLTGNVGIGTTNPTTALTVAGSSTSSVMSIQNLNNDGNSAINFLNANGTIAGRIGWGNTAGSSDAYLLRIGSNDFNSVDLFTGGTSRLRVDGSGNVGIGTTSPGANLEVSGTIKISGGNPGVGKVLTSDATGLATWTAPAATGITSLNGSTSATQTFAVATTGTNFGINTTAGVHTFNIPFAASSTVTAGLLSNADYVSFSNKLSTTLASGSIFVGNATGSATAVTLSGDATLSNAGVLSISTIPITKGGTGAVTSAAARTNLGLGTIATYNQGTSAGTVPVIGTGGLTPNQMCVAASDGLSIICNSTLPTSSQWTTSGTTINYLAGNVGIGTNSPSSTVHVVGSTDQSQLIVKAVSGQSVDPILYQNSVGTSLMSITASGGIKARAGSQTAPSLLFFNDGATGIFSPAVGNISITTSGTEKLRVDSSGNVGIGTTSPTSQLSFSGDSSQRIGLEKNTVTNSAGSGLNIVAGGATSGATNKAGGYLILSGGISTGNGASSIVFSTATASGSGTGNNSPTTKMTLDGDGNLSIGTTIPATNARLAVKDGHIQSQQTTAPTALVNSNAGTGGACTLENATDTAGRIVLTSGSGSWGAGTLCTITFSLPYAVAPIITFSACDAVASTVQARGPYITASTTGFAFATSSALNASGTGKFCYHVIETQ